MTRQHPGDGSAGDADYTRIGSGYGRYRCPEPEIAAAIVAALGDARTVLNVGAGRSFVGPDVEGSLVLVRATP
jgi:hypothetical protein